MAITFDDAPLSSAFFAAPKLSKSNQFSTHNMPTMIQGFDCTFDTLDFAEKLVALALLNLRDRGSIELNLVEKKVLFATKTSVVIRRRAQDAPPYPASGRALFEACADGASVVDAVGTWIGAKSASPSGVILRRVEADLVESGYLEPIAEEQRKQDGHYYMHRVADGKAGEIASLSESCAQRWNGYEQREPKFLAALVHDTREGIRSRYDGSGAAALADLV